MGRLKETLLSAVSPRGCSMVMRFLAIPPRKTPPPSASSFGMKPLFPLHLLAAAFALLPATGRLFAAPTDSLRPFLQRFCYECHGAGESKADLDFSQAEVLENLSGDHDFLENLQWVLAEEEMPPVDAEQPSGKERQRVLELLKERLTTLENASPDDPGLVLMPRLNQAEYNNVVRDLTGFDLKPARFFPADQIAESGFANMGAVLNVGTVHVQNYLAGAKWVLEHALISPERGIVWHPQRIETSDIEKLRETLLVKWYDWLAKKEAEVFLQTPTDGADFDVINAAEYFFAAWKFDHREELGRPEATLADFAAEADGHVAPVVLRRWYDLLQREDHTPLVGRLAEDWRSLPAPGRATIEQVEERVARIEKFFYANADAVYDGRWFKTGVQFDFQPEWETSRPNEPFGRRLGRYRRKGFPDWATHLMKQARYDFTIDLEKFGKRKLYLLVTDAGDGNQGDRVRLIDRRVEVDGSERSWEESGISVEVVQGEGLQEEEDGWTLQAPTVLSLQLPKDAKGELQGSFRLSDQDKDAASVQTLFVDKRPEPYVTRFYPRRQVLVWPENRDGTRRMAADLTNLFTRSGKISGRELSAALADVPGTPEDIMQRLGEFTDPSRYPDSPYFLNLEDLVSTLDKQELTYHTGLLADLQAYAEAPHQRLARSYEKAGVNGLAGTALIDSEHVEKLSGEDHLLQQVTEVEAKRRRQAGGVLRKFLRRVWRRPVTSSEVEYSLSLYDDSRYAGKSFDAAVKRPMTVAMIAPDFIFKLQRAAPGEVTELTDVELASRLSFFLWSSMPDEGLLDLAEAGKLRDTEVLLGQVDRMLQDDRSRAIGIEFAGRWLGFHGFDDYSQPDMDKFPEFTAELREAMYEEAIRFFQNLFANNRPIDDLVAADYTFLNETLAKHYQIDGVHGSQMRKVTLRGEAAKRRGGLFGLGSLLTVNSTPLRANPIYRGVWVIDKILGKPTPEPPPVPPLSEAVPPGKELRFHEILALHRADAACAVCHDRIDPPGLALEHFNAVGAWRQNDDDGNPVYAKGEMKDGRVVEGLAGVRTYVRQRMDDLMKQFCSKLATFGLGRDLIATDRPLITRMADAIRSDQGRVRAGLEVLVTSPQFLQKRSYRQLPETLTVAGPRPAQEVSP